VSVDLAKMLRFVVYVSAARADADPEQLQRLRTEVPPLLDQLRADGQTLPVVNRVREIMGPEWQPTGDWARQIHALHR
jgi:translation elongation factor EF-Tu-like GTPase